MSGDGEYSDQAMGLSQTGSGYHPPDVYEPPNQPDYNAIHLDTSYGKQSASHNQAAIARGEWADYKQRYRPIENELLGEIGNPDTYNSSVADARQSVREAFDTQNQSAQQQAERYNLSPADDDRQTGLAEAASEVTAANRARNQVYNRNMQLLGGGLAPKTPKDDQQGDV
jgi:hypothetical protein